MKLRHSLLLTALSVTAGAAFGATTAENWDNFCAKCHGPDGAAKTVVGKKLKLKDYTDDAVQAAMKDDDMFKATKDGVKDESGKERMKPYKADLSDAEINELVAHIRKMKK